MTTQTAAFSTLDKADETLQRCIAAFNNFLLKDVFLYQVQ